ncbi:MAG: DNA-binding protein [Oscillospiraceae bacterium]
MSDTKNYEKLIEARTLINEILQDCDNNESETVPDKEEPVEMLTIKECTQVVPGLSEYTVRLWVHQNKVKYRRAGKGERGKILVSKTSLLEYINSAAKLLLSE